jgi:DNA-binding response OmpR family regulator
MSVHVLMVDDDPAIVEAATELLTDEGYEVAAAGNGMLALEKLHAQRPDVILLDLMMPVMDGWTFVEQLRKDPSIGSIPIILLSAVRRLEDTAAELGAADYIRKPFDIDVLLGKIGAVLRRPSNPTPPATPVPPAA